MVWPPPSKIPLYCSMGSQLPVLSEQIEDRSRSASRIPSSATSPSLTRSRNVIRSFSSLILTVLSSPTWLWASSSAFFHLLLQLIRQQGRSVFPVLCLLRFRTAAAAQPCRQTDYQNCLPAKFSQSPFHPCVFPSHIVILHNVISAGSASARKALSVSFLIFASIPLKSGF